MIFKNIPYYQEAINEKGTKEDMYITSSCNPNTGNAF